jgi:hypothetical protein
LNVAHLVPVYKITIKSGTLYFLFLELENKIKGYVLRVLIRVKNTEFLLYLCKKDSIFLSWFHEMKPNGVVLAFCLQILNGFGKKESRFSQLMGSFRLEAL